MIKNYKELKDWKRIEETLIKSKNKSLESLNPRPLESLFFNNRFNYKFRRIQHVDFDGTTVY